MSIVCALAAAVSAPAVFAQGPTLEGYKKGIAPDTAEAIDVLPTVDLTDGTDPGTGPDTDPSSTAGSDPVSDPGSSEVASAEADSLPFTGLDVGIVALLGLALVGTGFAVRRVSRGAQA